MTNCIVLNSSAIACVAPPLTSFTMEGDDSDDIVLNYTVVMDSAPGPDLAVDRLQIGVVPNPGSFMLLTTQYVTGQQPPFTVQIAVSER